MYGLCFAELFLSQENNTKTVHLFVKKDIDNSLIMTYPILDKNGIFSKSKTQCISKIHLGKDERLRLNE